MDKEEKKEDSEKEAKKVGNLLHGLIVMAGVLVIWLTSSCHDSHRVARSGIGSIVVTTALMKAVCPSQSQNLRVAKLRKRRRRLVGFIFCSQTILFLLNGEGR